MDKTARHTDWSSPDLTPEQVRYAISDVTLLLPLKDRLEDMLEREGRRELARSASGDPGHGPLDLLGYEDLRALRCDAASWATEDRARSGTRLDAGARLRQRRYSSPSISSGRANFRSSRAATRARAQARQCSSTGSPPAPAASAARAQLPHPQSWASLWGTQAPPSTRCGGRRSYLKPDTPGERVAQQVVDDAHDPRAVLAQQAAVGAHRDLGPPLGDGDRDADGRVLDAQQVVRDLRDHVAVVLAHVADGRDAHARP